jgi:chromate transporter
VDAPDAAATPLRSVPPAGRVAEVFRAALVLGLTSFGGPIAHLGYFHREYVERRRWITASTYAELVALCQLLPGPASSQVGIAIGLLRAGWRGAIAAWLGFTLPSAALLTAFALLVAAQADLAGSGWLHGLKLAAVAIAAAAILTMWRSLAPDLPRRATAVAAAAGVLLLPGALGQVGVIAAGGLIGWWLLRGIGTRDAETLRPPVGRRAGLIAAATFVVLLGVLPLLAAATGMRTIGVVDAFYRAGSLVFGGGHVVLPLLAESVVAPGWVDTDTFLAGYGAAQAVPGPLFTFSAYLGASLRAEPNGVTGAAMALVAIFAPSFLLVGAALPFWSRLRAAPRFRGILAGASAAVVGVLIGAFLDPLWTSTIHAPADVVLAGMAFAVLVHGRVAVWTVVLALAVAGHAARILGLV